MRGRLGAGVLLPLLALLGVSLLGACTPRNNLGTGSTVCIRAIPVAAAELGHKGRPEGVREVRASALAKRFPEFAPLGGQTVCLVAFSDDFQVGDVPHARVQRAGKYVVVVVDTHEKVFEDFVGNRLPLRFAHQV